MRVFPATLHLKLTHQHVPPGLCSLSSRAPGSPSLNTATALPHLPHPTRVPERVYLFSQSSPFTLDISLLTCMGRYQEQSWPSSAPALGTSRLSPETWAHLCSFRVLCTAPAEEIIPQNGPVLQAGVSSTTREGALGTSRPGCGRWGGAAGATQKR